MNKLGPKLIAATMAVVLAVVMSVMVTYAWTVLSTAPVAEGIQITIGGSNTILVAPDLTKTVDGKTYHFPGGFSGKLNFSHHEAYAYLSEIASLMPVSTADGKHWIIPEYYDILDEAVLNGEACVGVMKPMEEFTVDTQLQYANLTEFSASGSYVYLDFWVVSPGTEYTLRMSHGDENGGSYLLELMDAAETADGGFVLTATEGTAAATARIGFLVNSNPAGETALSCYRESATFSDQYRPVVFGSKKTLRSTNPTVMFTRTAKTEHTSSRVLWALSADGCRKPIFGIVFRSLWRTGGSRPMHILRRSTSCFRRHCWARTSILRRKQSMSFTTNTCKGSLCPMSTKDNLSKVRLRCKGIATATEWSV